MVDYGYCHLRLQKSLWEQRGWGNRRARKKYARSTYRTYVTYEELDDKTCRVCSIEVFHWLNISQHRMMHADVDARKETQTPTASASHIIDVAETLQREQRKSNPSFCIITFWLLTFGYESFGFQLKMTNSIPATSVHPFWTSSIILVLQALALPGIHAFSISRSLPMTTPQSETKRVEPWQLCSTPTDVMESTIHEIASIPMPLVEDDMMVEESSLQPYTAPPYEPESMVASPRAVSYRWESVGKLVGSPSSRARTEDAAFSKPAHGGDVYSTGPFYAGLANFGKGCPSPVPPQFFTMDPMNPVLFCIDVTRWAEAERRMFLCDCADTGAPSGQYAVGANFRTEWPDFK